ncbi:hypothetical protein AB0L05_30480 [Nonomuraea pusilla]|uniref:hypothetical protein n=1 Tax=Nonomuraea pusilla TaxID=46177 RepID=UPI00332C738E
MADLLYAPPVSRGSEVLFNIGLLINVHPVVNGISGAVSIVIATTGTVTVTRDWQRRLAHAAEDPGKVLRDRITRINDAFAEAASLMEDLRRDLEAQQAARETLVAQAEEQQRLLEVNEEQAEKIRQILVGETKATIRAERRQQWMFFTLGVLVSIPIGVAINLLVP